MKITGTFTGTVNEFKNNNSNTKPVVLYRNANDLIGDAKTDADYVVCLTDKGNASGGDSSAVRTSEGSASGGFGSAVRTNKGDASGGFGSAVRTYEGDASGGDGSAVRTSEGNASGGDSSAVRTTKGDASGGHGSAVRTSEGVVSVREQSVGMGTELGKIGQNSVVALLNDIGQITKIVVNKDPDQDIELEVLE